VCFHDDNNNNNHNHNNNNNHNNYNNCNNHNHNNNNNHNNNHNNHNDSETMAEYAATMVEVAREVLAGIAAALGLEDERELEIALGPEPDVALRVNFYPRCPQPELTLGLSAHSDPGALTLLLPDDCNVSGLEIRAPAHLGGHWIPVHPRPDALIVNLGDQLQVIDRSTQLLSGFRV
jgi:isopenicillin N synthase-like dioxygenase